MKFLQKLVSLFIGTVIGSVLISEYIVLISDIRLGFETSNIFNWGILHYSILFSKNIFLFGAALAVPIFLILRKVGVGSYWLAIAGGILFSIVPLALMAFGFSATSQMTYARSERFFVTGLALSGADATFAYIARRFFDRSPKSAKATDVFT